MGRASDLSVTRRAVRRLTLTLTLVLVLGLAACNAEGAASQGADLGGDAASTDGAAATLSDGTQDGAGTATGADGQGSAVDGGDSASATTAETFAIGVTTIEVMGAANRKLPVEIWYPCVATPGAAAATYAFGLASSPHGAVRDATPLPGKRKLILFSHGNGGIREQSVFLTEWLARHGFVVASPEHVGNATLNRDSKLTPAMPLWRPQDIRATVDHLAAAPRGADPKWLPDVIDATTYAVMGHSFGGFTSLALAGVLVQVPPSFDVDCSGANAPQPVCGAIAAAGPLPWDLRDPRCVLAVPMAPAGYGWKMFEKIKPDAALPPIVIMGATGDEITPAATEQTPLYQDLPGPAALLLVEGSNHFVFSDICALEKVLPASFKSRLGDLCTPTHVPPLAEVHAVVADRALAAARLWLAGDANAATALKAPVGPGFSLQHKNIP